MFVAPRVFLDRPDDLTACQKLAAAVVSQALLDVLNPHLSAQVRSRAERFLAGSEDFTFWCTIAKVDPAFLRAAFARHPTIDPRLRHNV
jgi:hypothetical protein